MRQKKNIELGRRALSKGATLANNHLKAAGWTTDMYSKTCPRCTRKYGHEEKAEIEKLLYCVSCGQRLDQFDPIPPAKVVLMDTLAKVYANYSGSMADARTFGMLLQNYGWSVYDTENTKCLKCHKSTYMKGSWCPFCGEYRDNRIVPVGDEAEETDAMLLEMLEQIKEKIGWHHSKRQ